MDSVVVPSLPLMTSNHTFREWWIISVSLCMSALYEVHPSCRKTSFLVVNTHSLIPLTHSMAIPRCQCSILSSLEMWERIKGGSTEISEMARQTVKKNPENPCRTFAGFLLPLLTWQNYSANRGQFSSFHTEHWIDLLPTSSLPQCKVNPQSIRDTTAMKDCGGRMRHKLPLRGLFPCAG